MLEHESRQYINAVAEKFPGPAAEFLKSYDSQIGAEPESFIVTQLLFKASHCATNSSLVAFNKNANQIISHVLEEKNERA